VTVVNIHAASLLCVVTLLATMLFLNIDLYMHLKTHEGNVKCKLSQLIIKSINNTILERVSVAVIIYTNIWKVLGLNLGWDAAALTNFHLNPSLCVVSRTVTRLSPD
jgi:hypothetical protein